jgi:subtilisin family serine protease
VGRVVTGVRARLAAVGLASMMLLGLAAAPAVAAPGPGDHPEWWFDNWGVQGLWSGGARGQGILIGEIDTGVNANLPALSGKVLPGKDFGSQGGDGRTDRDVDPFGHGTAMASLMVAHAGQDNILGIAPDARVLPLAVPIIGTTDDAGDGANGDLVDAIRWAADHGAKIITMSLGAPREADDVGRSCPAKEQSTIDYALSKGAIVVASGGNSGDKGSPIEEPSVCLGVISVGAVDRNGGVPVWSSRHPYLTVTAPGVDIPSIGRIPGEAYYGDGTSQAAAITAGALALIWSKYPHLTGFQVSARLLATVSGKRPTRNPANGFGSINVRAAVTASLPADEPNPIYTAVAPFLAHDKIPEVKPPVVHPAATKIALPGNFSVTTASSPLASGQGLAGIIIAAVGLVALILIITMAIRNRRTRRRATPPATPGEPLLPEPEPQPEPQSEPEAAAESADTAATLPAPEPATPGESTLPAPELPLPVGESTVPAPESTLPGVESAPAAEQSAAEPPLAPGESTPPARESTLPAPESTVRGG